jgi:hypothetical protein
MGGWCRWRCGWTAPRAAESWSRSNTDGQQGLARAESNGPGQVLNSSARPRRRRPGVGASAAASPA